MNRWKIISALIAFTVFRAFGQSDHASSPLAFEVASVRPSNTGGRVGSVQFLPGGQRLTVSNMPLSGLILVAWRLTERQISASGALPFDRYDINAETDHPVSQDQLLMMLQTLLRDRFNLTMHSEVKELPVYALVPAKNGPELQRSAHGTSPSAFTIGGVADRGRLAMRHATLADFAWAMSRVNTLRDRIVIDKNHIPGEYDFDLTFAPDVTGFSGVAGTATPGPSAGENDSIFTAIAKQLGLTLEPQKSSVVCFVIDHAARPTRN